MRNNIIVILASIVGSFFIGATANAADPQNYNDVYKICSGTISKLPNPCSATNTAFTLIKNDSTIFANFKKNKVENGCSTAQDLAEKVCKTSSTVQNNQPQNANETSTYKVDTSKATATAQNPDFQCGADGKNIKTGKPCGGVIDTTQIKAKPTPTVSATSTAQLGATTYVKVDNGDGTYTTVLKDSDNKTINTIETKKNGHEVVFDADGKRVTGDKKEEILADKEIVDPKEKAVVKAKEDAAKKTENANTGDPEKNLTPEAIEAAAKAEAEAARAVANIKEKLEPVKTELEKENQIASEQNPQDTVKMANCTRALGIHQVAMGYLANIEKEEQICKRSSSIAGFLCPIANSPAVQTAATLMNASAAVIPSISSAKDTCKITSEINLAGQLLLTGGSAICLISKGRCENKCEEAKAHLANLEAKLAEIKTSGCQSTVDTVISVVQAHSKSDTEIIAKCNGFKGDAEKMTVTAMNMLGAAGQAKACEQKLASMESTDNKAQVYSINEMCAQPQNAASTLCKCRSDNTAPGCPGYVAGSGNEGNIIKSLSSTGASGMAGLSYGSKITPTGGASGLDTNLDGLSDEAKKALAAGGDQKQDGGMFGSAGGANAGGGAGTANGAGGVAGADKGKSVEEPKSIGSSFMNAVSSLFKGGSSGKAAPVKDEKISSDKYKEQIKRQIAAEQMRSEISSASGVDNWSKIRTRYKSNAGSLIDSN